MFSKFFTFSRFTLFVALCISSIAAWYSVLGLATIFSGAKIPIIVMGSILEIAKITTTVWLHHYWERASWAIRAYLTSAVIALALLTSMGIFGLLSKAHSDSGLISGDVQSQLALFDEKIRTQRDNIEVARKALQQMDSQVDARLARGDTEAGAERAVQIRRQQAPERARLQREIADAQKVIARLNEERAPVAAQNRKVEAEVGPIKYIAALIYGDNPDQNLLERAVRWVTILIVIVFDPLAIILILAANNSLRWEREEAAVATQAAAEPQEHTPDQPDPEFKQQDYVVNYSFGPITITQPEPPAEPAVDIPEPEPTPPADAWPTQWHESEPLQHEAPAEPVEPAQPEKVADLSEPATAPEPEAIDTLGVTTQAELFHPADGYVTYQGKTISVNALKEIRPDLVLNARAPQNEILFGAQFPTSARNGDIYIRVDQMPHRVFKFNNVKWLELDRETNTTYLQNSAYIQYIIGKIHTGEIDPETLTDAEQDEIKAHLARSV
jgi:hypothetical protein